MKLLYRAMFVAAAFAILFGEMTAAIVMLLISIILKLEDMEYKEEE